MPTPITTEQKQQRAAGRVLRALKAGDRWCDELKQKFEHRFGIAKQKRESEQAATGK
jgi:hypothetical protein